MQTTNFILENLTAFIVALTGFLGLPVISNFVSFIKLRGALSSIDKRQNETLEEVGARLDELARSLNVLLKDKDDYHFNKRIKQDLKDLANELISVNELDTSFESLILEGAERAGGYFSNIRVLGYSNIEKDKLRREAVMLLRGLRTYYGGQINTPESVIESLKINVVEPRLNNLLADLNKFKKNFTEGRLADPDHEFLHIASEFCRGMISAGIFQYNTYKK